MITIPKTPIIIQESSPKEIDRPWHCYKRGDFIPLSNNGVWQICRGWVQLSTISMTGEERILGWFGSSMWLSTWLTLQPAHQAKALSDTLLLWYSRGEIEKTPELCQSLLPQTGKHLRQVESLLATLKHKRVEDRLYHLLNLLKQDMGEPIDRGIRLAARLTHEDLANAIGTCRVTVTRLLGKLKQQGEIEIDSRGHLILLQKPDRSAIEKLLYHSSI
ncbi:MAG: Crp/Fnr family transcriptional regulator [Geitlerinemataceae cyanobacterium]